MKLFSQLKLALVLVPIFLSACAISPRTSQWDSPRGFTKSQVFNAAIQAGGQNSMTTTSSDRESGTMSLTRRIGKGDLTLAVQVADTSGMVKVRTTAQYGGGVAIAGLHEEQIREFHRYLFQNLSITDPAATNVRIEEAR